MNQYLQIKTLKVYLICNSKQNNFFSISINFPFIMTSNSLCLMVLVLSRCNFLNLKLNAKDLLIAFLFSRL